MYSRIDEELKEKGITKKQLAKMADIPYTTFMSAYSRKSGSFSIEYIKKIAAALDMSIGYLMGDTLKEIESKMQYDAWLTEKYLERLYEIGRASIEYNEKGEKIYHVKTMSDEVSVEYPIDDALIFTKKGIRIPRKVFSYSELPDEAKKEVDEYLKYINYKYSKKDDGLPTKDEHNDNNSD